MPPIFRLIEEGGNVDRDEMYRVFNMGIGMVVICLPDSVGQLTEALPGAKVIGKVIGAEGKERVIIS